MVRHLSLDQAIQGSSPCSPVSKAREQRVRGLFCGLNQGRVELWDWKNWPIQRKNWVILPKNKVVLGGK